MYANGPPQINQTRDYMLSHLAVEKMETSRKGERDHCQPSSLDVATYAVMLLENNPLFNSGHGAVFTRDGINQLEASVMVSRGHPKRGVGVMGLRRVKNPILLAKAMLQHGDEDLDPATTAADKDIAPAPASVATERRSRQEGRLNVPSAQGHTQIYGQAAEQLAQDYGLELVNPRYFFTQQRWDEHVRALKREEEQQVPGVAATWSADEHLPQGTVGAVALDADGVVCVATSTGGMTNKLTGRVGDTPVPGAGFWAEEWEEDSDSARNVASSWEGMVGWGNRTRMMRSRPDFEIQGALKGLFADCLPSLGLYVPLPLSPWMEGSERQTTTTTTRSVGGSGTGNGDSFLRVNALRTLAAMMRWKPEPGARAVSDIAGPGGELQRSAGSRWGRTGEGEGGIIGIELTAVWDLRGRAVEARSEMLMDYNCGGMYRAWIDDNGKARMSIWTNGADDGYRA